MKKENRLLTIDGETLMSQPLTPLNFVVDTRLSQGLHILAGSPKVGKSWLALWLAVTVAKGESIWGMGVKQGTTLYLCLEDSTLRIQNRLFEITEDAPANVHFTTNSDTLAGLFFLPLSQICRKLHFSLVAILPFRFQIVQ
ncbi:AAA family ATPase [Dysosmobacter sp.]|uniref:AAA family ATPase n=1 Tax=Dysosmobacter sp. TaxID=2591382 RepID=UPI002671C1CC|nr:AAA family ATPase [Dysosmobacter sp.]MCI7282603.1 helicase RepA family protein [Dysosmobacter sp.]